MWTIVKNRNNNKINRLQKYLKTAIKKMYKRMFQ